MDFIVICPHCSESISVDRFNFFDVDFYWSDSLSIEDLKLETSKFII